MKDIKLARNHHFVPQGYLAGFSNSGTREGQLCVFDRMSRSFFKTKPRNVAAARDFNRIDVEGKTPDAIELAFGELEGKAIEVIRKIQVTGVLPPDEEFCYVLNLMALMILRNPRSRRNMNNARSRTVRLIGDVIASDKRFYENQLVKAKESGFVPQDAEVTFEEMRDVIYQDKYTVTISTSDSLALELGGFDKVLQMLGYRYWSLVTAAVDAPDFATCDHPVTIVFKDPNRCCAAIGYGLPNTVVSFPLNTRQALLGVLEEPLELNIVAQSSQVADINSRTLYNADRQVYSKTDIMVVLRGNELYSMQLRQFMANNVL